MLSKLNIATRILLLTGSITVVVIVVSLMVSGSSTRSALEAEAFNRLTAVREMKSQQVEDYFRSIRNQIVTFSEDQMVVDAMQTFSDSFLSYHGELVPRIDSFANADTVLRAYYENEFLPRLSANRQEAPEMADFWSEHQTTRLLQYQYIANNPNPLGEKHKLDATNDYTSYTAAHRNFHPIIRSYLETFGYYDIFLVDIETGHIVYSVFKEVDYATSLLTGPYKDSNLSRVFRAARDADAAEFTRIIDFDAYAPSYDAEASFIASPIFDGARKTGVLIFQMPVDRINDIMSNQQRWKDVGLGDTGETYIVGDDHALRNQSRFLIEDKEAYLQNLTDVGVSADIVSRIDSMNSSIGLQKVDTEGVRAALGGTAGVSSFPGYRGTRVLSSYGPLSIDGLDWAILSEIGEQETLVAFSDLQDRLIMVGSALLALAIYLSYFLALSLTRPLRFLRAAAEELSAGNLGNSIKLESQDEFGDLAANFENMRIQLNQTFAEVQKKNDELEDEVEKRTGKLNEALASVEEKNKTLEDSNIELERIQDELISSRERTEASEQRISSIVEASPDGIISITGKGTIETFNKSAETMFGYQAAEIVGKNIKILMPKAIALEHDYILEKYISGSPSKVVNTLMEVEGRRKDGSRFPVELAVAEVDRTEGLGFIGILRDITEFNAMRAKETKAANEARILDRAAAVIAAATSFEQAYEDVIALICSSLSWNIGHVYGLSKDGGTLSSMDIWYRDEPGAYQKYYEVNQNYSLKIGEGMVGGAAETGEVDWIEDINNDDRFPDKKLVASLELKGAFALPVIANGKVLVVLEFFCKDSVIVDEDEKQVMRNVAQLISQGVERKNAADQLAEAKQLADDANQAKSDFLANMSHEIRTPMNAIIGFSELCLRTEMTDKQQDYLDKINSSSNALLGIINDILDFSKIEAGKLDMEVIPFEIDGVLEDLATVVSVKTQAKGIELLFSRPPQVPAVLMGDPLRLGQILINLANNAVKFTESGEIVISIDVEEETDDGVTLKFVVRDTGIGMPEAQLAKLFQSFSQGDASTTRRYGGTGLGLAITKQLVEMMGGSIQVESEEGHGSTFSFTAKMGVAEESAARKLVVTEDLKGLRALVVDDNATSREIISDYLKAFTFDVETATNAEETFARLEAPDRPIDFLVLDWRMPGMDGLEIATKINNDMTLAALPKIILLSAFGRAELAQKDGAEFVEDILTKPVSPSHLFDSIMTMFGKQVGHSLRRRDAGSEPDMAALRPIQGAHLLLVEDNDVNQQVAQELLELAGFYVDIAGNGEEAIKMLKKGAYDGVLMDIQMPIMDGYTATGKIRKIKKYKKLPILAMTANATLEDRDRALAAGMNDHIPKPINQRDLFSKLLEWLPAGERQLPPGYVAPGPRAQAEFPALDGIDTVAGLERVSGNTKSYGSLLHKFAANQGDVIKQLKTALKAGDRDLSVRLAHTLKSVSGNVGATLLQQGAATLEAAIIADAATVPAALLNKVARQLSRVVSTIHKSLPDDEPGAPAAAIGSDELRGALQALLEKLTEYDTESVDLLDNLLPRVAKGDQRDGLLDLRKLVDGYKFDEAVKALGALLSGL